jgi:hypothetical protein
VEIEVFFSKYDIDGKFVYIPPDEGADNEPKNGPAKGRNGSIACR